LRRRPEAQIRRIDREKTPTHLGKLAAVPDRSLTRLSRLRPAAERRPAQALHGPAGQREHEQAGDEKDEEETLLHVHEATAAGTRAHRRAERPSLRLRDENGPMDVTPIPGLEQLPY